MQRLEFIYKRCSVRKFTNEPVLQSDIEAMLQAAIAAPSGKNQQNWHFVIIKNTEKIQEIAKIVEEKNAYLCQFLATEEQRTAFKSSLPYQNVFKTAPILVLVYAGHYPHISDQLLKDAIMPTDKALEYRYPNPGIQNIAAALENFQLSAANLGYGTCWLTGATYAGEEISQYIGFDKPGYRLAALSSLGVPENKTVKNPPRKPLSEVTTFID